LAFFFVFGPLFTDGPSGFLNPERLVSYALSFGVYVTAGALLGLARPRSWSIVCALDSTAVFLATLYALKEPDIAGLAVVYGALAVLASALGVWLGGLRR
jgi:hypothetical protein